MSDYPPTSYKFEFMDPPGQYLLFFVFAAMPMIYYAVTFFNGREAGVTVILNSAGYVKRSFSVKFLYGKFSLEEASALLGIDCQSLTYITPLKAKLYSTFFILLAMITIGLAFVNIYTV